MSCSLQIRCRIIRALCNSQPWIALLRPGSVTGSNPDLRAAPERYRLFGQNHLTGERINNQGRVRSGNIAAKVYDGLLFRSRPEVLFYKALKRKGVPFAPLSVVLRGGLDYRRPAFWVSRYYSRWKIASHTVGAVGSAGTRVQFALDITCHEHTVALYQC